MILQRKSDGSHWPAGKTVVGLVAALNHARADGYFTDHEHERKRQYAWAIRGRMRRLGIVQDYHWREADNGLAWPIRPLD